jgi:hypothetical protein
MTHSAEWVGRSPAIARVSNAEAERWEDRSLRDEGHYNLTMRQ